MLRVHAATATMMIADLVVVPALTMDRDLAVALVSATIATKAAMIVATATTTAATATTGTATAAAAWCGVITAKCASAANSGTSRRGQPAG